ncbi:putative transcriptional activator SRCAP homolog [Sulfuriferula multivorans]|uniref:Putative transcriptional activator SRCAP homolog n=1 Tax=Sulfuriferula multivorans TaxID=1559896 RepID=A0A401JAW6_9PROT|nr:DUF6603 domain-containing protein [Sulfuriferula multivorans]GBL44759.1 putative transcriptional activator SRCAP homolog [Sulfuriferula multivorans]
MAQPDAVFQKCYSWFRDSVSQAVSALPAADQAAAEQRIWQMLGLTNANVPLPANPDINDFRDTGATAESLALAAQIVAESLAALDNIKQAVDALQGGNPAAALGVIAPILRQLEQLRSVAGGRYPSAFSLGKILLTLSGDAQTGASAGQRAQKLATLLGASAAQSTDTQAALGLVTLLGGSLLDRSFAAPNPGFPLPGLPALAPNLPKLNLNAPGLGGTLEFSSAPPGIRAALNLAVNPAASVGGFKMSLTSSAGVSVFVPVLPPGQVQVSGDFGFTLSLSHVDPNGALVIGSDELGAKLSIGELGMALTLSNAAPAISVFARQGKATLKPRDGFLKLILGEGIALDFAVEAEADKFGTLRLKNGSGLKASLPVPTLPTGPFQLQLINFGIAPDNGSFLKLQIELSASFGVALGPFQASIDRLGVLLDVDASAPSLGFEFKPPNGVGLSLDAGIVKGGGYLFIDPASGDYGGALELKLMAIGVKAIALISTKTPAGYSLLLLIYGQFPAIQLSFGFTLTGIGGLIGVQHTASPTALSQGISNGALDAVLFPANPVGDAPKIINTLRTLFPVKAGGFVIGPMLELGWGTPSLVTVRLGLLIEANQFVILGQAIVQLPPLVSADLALLYLRLDFVGSVVFDPLRIAFDAKLVNSRVAFISITGQFAFRAEFGSHPTFLISAGGFHPAFKEIPSDIPMPFDRVGASFDIGFVGISYKGYFAITSATVQAGSEVRAWADIGIASIEGGFGFDAICYLQPKFYFQIDLYAYLAVQVFGLDFASIRLSGQLAGPGRWHIAGRAEVETPWPLPDFSINIDQAWGTDRDTPVVTVKVADLLGKEISSIANWSAQLPASGEAFLTLADVKTDGALLAHPLGSLAFQQKLVPLELRMSKASGSLIDGANEFRDPVLQLVQGAAAPASKASTVRSDYFAAAQFLDLSQDERLSKPSFEAYPAGYQLREDGFELDTLIEVELGYEEADLGEPEPVPRNRRLLSEVAFLQSKHGALMQFGSAGLSGLRDTARLQPAQSTALKVNPVPQVLASKDSLSAAPAVALQTSVWQAEQLRRYTPDVNAARIQIAELAELTV